MKLAAICTLLLCAQAALAATAIPCAPPSGVKPRIFSNNSGHWREYQAEKEVPADHDSDERIQAFGAETLVYSYAGEDWTSTTTSCYDATGKLESLNFEVRTAWGWGYREQRALEHGTLIVVAKSYFSTEKGEQIPHPKDADDVPDARRPQIYAKISDAPIYNFLRAAR